jgi:hypothetical protein
LIKGEKMLLPLNLNSVHIEQIQSEAQHIINQDFSEYLPESEPPRLSFGEVEIILRAYEKLVKNGNLPKPE